MQKKKQKTSDYFPSMHTPLLHPKKRKQTKENTEKQKERKRKKIKYARNLCAREGEKGKQRTERKKGHEEGGKMMVLVTLPMLTLD